MRIAVLSDIHGNVRALQAVLADIERRTPDIVVDLGDCVSGPLQAADTADLLMDRAFPTVRGNHDRQLLGDAATMVPTDSAAFAQLGPRHLTWLASFPSTIQLEGVLFCHGTPTDDSVYLLETVEASGTRLSARDEIRDRMSDPRQAIVLCGHSHIPRTVLVDEKLVVNPGSVGLQGYDNIARYFHYMETGSPHARYAIIEAGTRPGVEHIAVEYDWNAASADAARAGRPDWAHALATGFALRA